MKKVSIIAVLFFLPVVIMAGVAQMAEAVDRIIAETTPE